MDHEVIQHAPKNEQASYASTVQSVKVRIHQQLLDTLDFIEARKMTLDQLHAECTRRLDVLLNEQRCPLTAQEKANVIHEIMDEIFGLGPLEVFLRDATVSDILVNGPHQIYVERFGRLEQTGASFRDANHLMAAIQRIAANVGRRIDEASPMLDARLPDGTRVNAIIPPLSLVGPAMSLRRFAKIPIDMNRLIELETLTVEMAEFLRACVKCKINVLISGGTGTGKTTFLNALSREIPVDERLLTIEDAAELQLQREHVVRLESRPPNIEGKGEVTQRDLLRNSLRMRPDRIIIGEVRGAEALDMLQAMNTGHEGSMTTVHANSPRDALGRVENMVSMAGLNYPVHVIRQQISSALQLLIHLDRLTGGRRKVVRIEEITGMEGEKVCIQDIFTFTQSGVDEQGYAVGQFQASGVAPQLLRKIRSEGVELAPNFFHNRVLSFAARG
jgi:pilus assembly protein CpaF